MTKLEQYLQSLQRFGIKPGLERIRALLALAGDPQHQYPIVLVGGTNGKGSTCEFLARLLQQGGKTTGLYTSPHIYRWNERIRILKSIPHPSFPIPQSLFPGAITDCELNSLFEAALPHIEEIAASPHGQPTEFEVLTLLGLWHFARQEVDIAVVEVGLGGRWDATNATEPTVSVITHVALDHCDRLGNTLEEIAADKVEIARPGRPLVTAETKPNVLEVFRDHLRKVDGELRIAQAPKSPDFQEINHATAQLAQQTLYEALNWPQSQISKIEDERSVVGRFEIIQQNPTLILDAANNPDGAQILARRLEHHLAASPPRHLTLVLGILADKDYAAMVEVLAPLAKTVIATQSHSPRAASARVVALEAEKYCEHVETITPVPAAVDRALELAGDDGVVCLTGSFYTISEWDRAKSL